MNLARKATALAAKAGCALTLASLACLVRADGITADPVTGEAAIAKQSRTERVSVDSTGMQANGGSLESAISEDGRFIVFTSSASNLVPGLQSHPGPPPGTGSADIFVHDRTTGVTELISINSAGQQGNQNSINPALSADGRVVAFRSYANNLVPGDTNAEPDVFVHDRTTGGTERVSVASDGTQANGESYSPTLSADGRFVAFISAADNLVPGDTNNQQDIFVHEAARGTQ